MRTICVYLHFSVHYVTNYQLGKHYHMMTDIHYHTARVYFSRYKTKIPIVLFKFLKESLSLRVPPQRLHATTRRFNVLPYKSINYLCLSVAFPLFCPSMVILRFSFQDVTNNTFNFQPSPQQSLVVGYNMRFVAQRYEASTTISYENFVALYIRVQI